MEEKIKDRCDRLRAQLLDVEQAARGLRRMISDQDGVHDPSESIAQSMLAVRHIEDARMRLGKVIQHARDGVSIYDNPPRETEANDAK